MKIKTYLVALSALAFGSAMRADEGMWLLQLMKQQNSIELMKKQGLKLEADDLYNPGGVSLKDAVGIFGYPLTSQDRRERPQPDKLRPPAGIPAVRRALPTHRK